MKLSVEKRTDIMNQQFDNTNKGTLFVNDQKSKETSPDYSGKVNVNGREFRIAGWKKQSKAGKTFLSLSVSDPQNAQRPAASTAPVNQGGGGNAMPNDSIPF